MSLPFQKVLVPVDLSDANGPAIEAARRIACAPGAAVTLLHVVETIPDLPEEEATPFYARIEASARDRLARLVDDLAGAGVQAQAMIVYGRRAREIVGAAALEEADLIVMRSHRIEPKSPTEGWATLSYQVAVLAPCAVLLVK